jgi:hypothetical protein
VIVRIDFMCGRGRGSSVCVVTGLQTGCLGFSYFMVGPNWWLAQCRDLSLEGVLKGFDLWKGRNVFLYHLPVGPSMLSMGY